MWWGIGFGGLFLDLVLVFTLGLMTLRKGHTTGSAITTCSASLSGSSLPWSIRAHRRGCTWRRVRRCLEHGRIEDALEHAAATDDVHLVAEIVAAEHRTLLRAGRLATVLRWCRSLPEEVMLGRPELPLAAALAAGSSDVRRTSVAVSPHSPRRRDVGAPKAGRRTTRRRWGSRIRRGSGATSLRRSCCSP